MMAPKRARFCEDYSLVSNTLCCVGSHRAKLDSYYDTFLQFVAKPEVPAQIFSGNPRSLQRPTPVDDDIESATRLVEEQKLKVFIHASYVVNLSAQPGYLAPLRYVEGELRLGDTLGVKGIVVHVGKSVKETPNVGLARMHATVATLLQSATPRCRLLLETPAGQGTELLKRMEDFFAFVAEYAEDDRFGVVIDTCHVFATGYEPSAYISSFISRFGAGKLALVHFNDSKTEMGSFKDRHEVPGVGHIGSRRLCEVAKLCETRGIPMVAE
jgi:deoxyribonuclease-4